MYVVEAVYDLQSLKKYLLFGFLQKCLKLLFESEFVLYLIKILFANNKISCRLHLCAITKHLYGIEIESCWFIHYHVACLTLVFMYQLMEN
jgi:hypothetical protein